MRGPTTAMTARVIIVCVDTFHFIILINDSPSGWSSRLSGV